MSTINAILKPDADGTLHLPVPEAWRHQSIKVKAELEPLPPVAERAKPGLWKELRGYGCLRGKLWISPDFDEPLEDFKDYMG